VLDELAGPLTGAQRIGLGASVALVTDDTGVGGLTVSDTLEGIRRRRGQLHFDTPDELLADLDRRLAVLRKRLERLDELPSLLEQVEADRRRLATAERRLRELTETADRDVSQQLDELRQGRNELEGRIREAAARRAALVDQQNELGDDATAERWRYERDELLATHGVTRDLLSDAVAEADRDFETAGTDLHFAAKELDQSTATLSGDEMLITRIADALASDPDLSWVREAGVELPRPGQDRAAQARVLAHLTDQFGRVDGALSRLRGRLEATQGTLGAVRDKLRGQQADEGVVFDVVLDWAAREIEAWFSDPAVRRALLPEAESLEVDLGDRVVRWWEGGALRERPLEAFSSGEQVFALTRARLALLDTRQPLGPKRQRLVFLDEFGAFVAENRKADLAELLRKRRDDRPEESFVCVFPLTRDYRALAESSLPEHRTLYGDLADQLDNREYFTAAFPV